MKCGVEVKAAKRSGPKLWPDRLARNGAPGTPGDTLSTASQTASRQNDRPSVGRTVSVDQLFADKRHSMAKRAGKTCRIATLEKLHVFARSAKRLHAAPRRRARPGLEFRHAHELLRRTT